MPHIDIKDPKASYTGSILVLNEVNMRVEKGEVISIIGPYGSSKSTMLRVLIGLLLPTSGTIEFDGDIINYGSKLDVRRLRDRCTIVLQQFSLFQNMSALHNVSIAPIKIKNRNRGEVDNKAKLLLAKAGLGEKQNSSPDELSRGQQRRDRPRARASSRDPAAGRDHVGAGSRTRQRSDRLHPLARRRRHDDDDRLPRDRIRRQDPAPLTRARTDPHTGRNTLQDTDRKRRPC